MKRAELDRPPWIRNDHEHRHQQMQMPHPGTDMPMSAAHNPQKSGGAEAPGSHSFDRKYKCKSSESRASRGSKASRISVQSSKSLAGNEDLVVELNQKAVKGTRDTDHTEDHLPENVS